MTVEAGEVPGRGGASWPSCLGASSRTAVPLLIADVLLSSSHDCYSLPVPFTVDWDEGALAELRRLPAAERGAVMNAAAKLEALGDQLGWPHTSQVKGSRAGSGSCGPARAAPPGGCCTGGWRAPW